MTTRSLTRSRGLHMSLLGLTASASIVAGVFVAAAPAYSDDGVPDVSASCLVATEEDATVHVSSILHAGEPVHAEGSGWGPSSGTTRGFVIVTLDDGKERRPPILIFPIGCRPPLRAIGVPGGSRGRCRWFLLCGHRRSFHLGGRFRPSDRDRRRRDGHLRDGERNGCRCAGRGSLLFSRWR